MSHPSIDEKRRARIGYLEDICTIYLDDLSTTNVVSADIPLPDGFADVVISNGVLNLTLNEVVTLREWARVLRPGGRLLAGDIIVARPVPQSAADDISLWTG